MENIDRIAKLFSTCKEKERPAFVGYVCACDPNFDTSLEICRKLIEQGVDLLELGVPFSDPLADGLTNQLAAQRARGKARARARGRGARAYPYPYPFTYRYRDPSPSPVPYP